MIYCNLKRNSWKKNQPTFLSIIFLTLQIYKHRISYTYCLQEKYWFTFLFFSIFLCRCFFFCSNTNSNQINAFSHIEITKHTLNTSHVAENGRTANPTSKSATAKLTIKKFVTLLSLCEQNTAAITKQLPTITNTFINARTASDTKFPGSVHFTESISVQLLIALH